MKRQFSLLSDKKNVKPDNSSAKTEKLTKKKMKKENPFFTIVDLKDVETNHITSVVCLNSGYLVTTCESSLIHIDSSGNTLTKAPIPQVSS
jgi:hypothetical protein